MRGREAEDKRFGSCWSSTSSVRAFRPHAPPPFLSHSRIGLVPRENAHAWPKHLPTTTPSLPSRSAGWYQRTNLLWHCAGPLLRLLEAYKPSTAQSITVGRRQFPNVCKSG